MKSIMPEANDYLTEPRAGYHKHHIFNGNPNRKLSEKYGLFVWIAPDRHDRIHRDEAEDIALKQRGQKAAMETYGWTVDDFRAIFGKNFL